MDTRQYDTINGDCPYLSYLSHVRWGALAVILVWTLACRGVAAADTLTLKEGAYVRGPTVLLGEIADIEGENSEYLAALELSSAALPGQSKNVNAALIESRMRNAGVDTQHVEIRGASRVRMTTMYSEITKEQIARSLCEYIESEMPWEPCNAEISVPLPMHDLVIPEGEVTFMWRPGPQYRYLGPGGFHGTISVDGQVYKTLLCKASVEAYGNVLAAARDIPRGHILSSGDLEELKQPLSTVPTGACMRVEDVIGLVARKTIFPGQTLTTRNVEPRTLIRRRALCQVEMRAAGLVVQSRARALMDGCAGDVVTCVNMNSGQEFQGVVRQDGVLVVP